MEARLEPTGAHGKVDEMRPRPTGHKSRLVYYLVAGLALVAVVAGIVIWRQGGSKQAAAPPRVPVTAAEATQHDVPIYYDALGTVQAFNTVAIRAQVTGQIVSINFRQGQEVHQGDVLAKIDPAPFQANFEQTVAKKSEDEALLVDGEKDLERSNTL